MYFVSLIVKAINYIMKIIGYGYEYRHIFKLTGIFATRKFKKAKNNHTYGILIAARNEETVIGNLIESIKQQDYPGELVKIFVCADNCTDNTAKVARECGAVCYERFDETKRTKGYALQYLVECIRRDYGIESLDGYIIFDADNLLKKDYLKNMNDSFDAGEKIVTSYRNSKNFDDNWISASYAIHWLRTVRNEHRARSFFHLATRIQGTGFLFANELIKDGWKYTSLTEDRAFCADAVAMGYKISYNNKAEFYDEQPVDMKIAMRQRIRWAKGHLQAVSETGPSLFKHIFVTNGNANKNEAEDVKLYKKIFNNIRFRFMSYDMLTVVFPYSLVLVIKKVVVYFLRISLIVSAELTISENYAPQFFKDILDWFNISFGRTGGQSAVGWLTLFFFLWTVNSYFKGILTAVYIFIVEYKRIKPMPIYKKIWYSLTFPIFDLIGKVSMCIAMFIKVEWKPIPHNANINIGALEKQK